MPKRLCNRCKKDLEISIWSHRKTARTATIPSEGNSQSQTGQILQLLQLLFCNSAQSKLCEWYPRIESWTCLGWFLPLFVSSFWAVEKGQLFFWKTINFSAIASWLKICSKFRGYLFMVELRAWLLGFNFWEDGSRNSSAAIGIDSPTRLVLDNRQWSSAVHRGTAMELSFSSIWIRDFMFQLFIDSIDVWSFSCSFWTCVWGRSLHLLLRSIRMTWENSSRCLMLHFRMALAVLYMTMLQRWETVCCETINVLNFLFCSPPPSWIAFFWNCWCGLQVCSDRYLSSSDTTTAFMMDGQCVKQWCSRVIRVVSARISTAISQVYSICTPLLLFSQFTSYQSQFCQWRTCSLGDILMHIRYQPLECFSCRALPIQMWWTTYRKMLDVWIFWRWSCKH